MNPKDINWKEIKSERVAHLILKIFKTLDLNIYTKAYLTYVGPLLEYNTPIWSPHLVYQVKMVESVQRTYTKKVFKKLNIKFNSYTDRLQVMGIKSLEYRRLKFDIILLYKILNNLLHVNNNVKGLLKKSQFLNKYSLRRHHLCLHKPRPSRTAIRNHFFTNRIIRVWNKLPTSLVSSKTLNIFKMKLNNIDLTRYSNLYIN